MEFLKRVTISFFVIAIILLAIVMGGIRLAIMNIEYFKPEIEYLFERDLSPGFVFTGLSGDVNHFNPILRVENVSMTLPDQSQPLFIDRLEIEFDFWASWRENAPVVREITGKLEKLELIKDEAGNWSTNDVSLALDPDSGPAPEFRQILGLVPRYLNLSLNRLIVHDRKTGTSHQLDRIKAQINHLQDQFYVKFSAALPDQLGQGILVKSIVGPDSSVIYLNSSNLQLVPVARLFDLDTWGLQQGALDGEVWINMSGYDVLAVNGDLVLKNGVVQMTAEREPLAISYSSRFSALQLPSSWRIANSFKRLNIDNRNVAVFDSQLEIADGSENRVVSAWVDRLQLVSLPVVAGQWLPAGVSEQIAQGRLDGQLQDILFSLDLDQPREFYFSAQASDLRSQAFAGYPGADNFNADILLGRQRMGFRIHGSDVTLDFGDHFDQPFKLDQLELEASAKILEQGLVLAVDDLRLQNQDISAGGRMWMEFDQDEAPFTFIRASFSDGNGASTSKYLPRNYMPLEAQAWLDRGIRNGFVPEGEMQFHGRLRDIRELNREKAGEFFVDFALERGDVYFSPGWMPASDGSGRVLFHNVSMDIDLERVSYDQIDGARAFVSIADFEDPELSIRIETESSSELAVNTWLDTPVGKQYRQVMKNLHDLQGNINTRVDFSMPLSGEDKQPEVAVQVDFDNASAQSESWGISLSQVNGRLQVTPTTMKARSIRANYFGDPITIDIDSLSPGGNTLVSARGKVDTAKLLNKLPTQLTSNMRGKSDWRIGMNFAGISTPKSKPFMRLRADSDLESTQVDLPHPFAKPAKGKVEVSAEVDFFRQQIWFSSKVGNDILARGQLLPTENDDFNLNLLDLAFSSELKSKPRQGLHLYGWLEEVSVDDWVRFIKSSDGGNLELLQSVELDFDRAVALKRDISGLRIELRQGERQYFGKVESSIMNGKFTAPWQPTPTNPLVIDLSYLQIDKLEQDTGEADLRPEDLTDFRLTSKALVFHDMLFSDLHVEARAVADKLHVDRLGLKKENLVLTGMAQWDYDASDQSHLSSITMSIQGDMLGTALAGMGFDDTMRGGTLNFSGGFTWPAPLSAFTVDNLVGDARFQIDEGVLNNVEPGAGGKFVGLFSLSALPRRLSLDFSDILIKGMEFERISGSYRIEDGILHTRNTRMDGHSATIKISGETDIAKREYNQNVKVTPKLRQTLPVLGAVTVGSTVGWGLLLLQNLFKKAIDEAVEVEYQITGSWDDPQIELIKAVDENQKELPKIER